jgi:hypothetical protein
MDPIDSVLVPSSRVAEGSEAGSTDDGALGVFLPYPEIWGLSSPSAPGEVPAAISPASALPVKRPPGSGLLCGRSRRS